MKSLNSVKENRAVLTDKFKSELESFFMAYPVEDFKMCLKNIYSGYLSSELCTLNLPKVREKDGVMMMEFMEVLVNGGANI